eukprot:768441-Hanusia_phi.AAC.20
MMVVSEFQNVTWLLEKCVRTEAVIELCAKLIPYNEIQEDPVAGKFCLVRLLQVRGFTKDIVSVPLPMMIFAVTASLQERLVPAPIRDRMLESLIQLVTSELVTDVRSAKVI